MWNGRGERRDQVTAESSEVPRIPGLLADSHEPTGLTPPVAGNVPAQDEVALGAVPDEAGHVAVPIRVHPDGTECDERELALDVRVLLAEREELLDARRTQTELVHVLEHLGRGRHLVQVDENDLDAVIADSRRTVGAAFHSVLADARTLNREVLLHDVGVGVVVLAGGDHLRQGAGEVDGDGVGDAGLDLGRALEERDDLPGNGRTSGDDGAELIIASTRITQSLDDLEPATHTTENVALVLLAHVPLLSMTYLVSMHHAQM